MPMVKDFLLKHGGEGRLRVQPNVVFIYNFFDTT
jgi:hypothetical protein